jgi:hypothetical protein
MTAGGGEDGDEDEGSDSQPSEDNFDEKELALINDPVQADESPTAVKSKRKPAKA